MVSLNKRSEALRLETTAIENVGIDSLDSQIFRVEGCLSVECSWIMSSFDFDRVIAGTQPRWRHAFTFRMTHETVTDTFIDIMPELRPGQR